LDISRLKFPPKLKSADQGPLRHWAVFPATWPG